MRTLSVESVHALRQACVDDTLDEFADKEIVLIRRCLPGRAVIGATRRDGLLWIILDPDVEDARQHLRVLIEQWPAHIGLWQITEDEVIVLRESFAPPPQRCVERPSVIRKSVV